MRYYKDQKHLLSAGLDGAVRFTSTIQDHQNVELSQKLGGEDSTRIRLPVGTALDASATRERDWDNVVTAHQDSDWAQLWRFENKVVGEHRMRVAPGDVVRAVAVSRCGNFALLGTENGAVGKFNMQSGVRRGVAPAGSHSLAVMGVASDAFNRHIVSAGLDGRLQVYDFETLEPTGPAVDVGSPISSLVMHHESGLCACACDDFAVRVFDIQAGGRLVRVFRGHANRVNDVCFSADSRWLVSVGMDCALLVWDLPSSSLVDAMRLESPATSVSLSPNADRMATTHMDSLAIHLWSNWSLLQHVALKPLDVAVAMESPAVIALPTAIVGGEDWEDEGEGDDAAVISRDESAQRAVSGEPLGEGLVTLSTLPRNRWETLPDLDEIRARNAPTEPLEKEADAPFFLPSVVGLDKKVQFDVSGAMETEEGASRVRRVSDMESRSVFAKRLLAAHGEGGVWAPVLEHLARLSASGMELAIVSLLPDELAAFIDFLGAMARSRVNYELCQAWTAAFLKAHEDSLLEEADLASHVAQLREPLAASWRQLESLSAQAQCLLALVSGNS